jgi:hypothetical protein
MKMPHAIFGSALVLAIAIVFAALSPAESQRRADGFMVASDGRALVWRVNTTTGAVSYCVRRSDSNDPGYVSEQTPTCSRFSPPVSQ